jgi:HTH-type transcriptional regulator/antitoxin HigA
MAAKADPDAVKGRLQAQASGRSPRPSNVYLDLINAYPLRPIRSKREHDRAVAVLAELLAREKSLGQEEQDYCEVLGREIEHYESTVYPMPSVSPVEALRHLIEAREGPVSKVAAGANIANSTLSEILAEKRQLNLTHIRKLALFFGVPESTFLP